MPAPRLADRSPVVPTDTLVAGAAFVPPNPPSVISSITRATNVVTVMTGAPHGFTVGTRVTVRSTKGNVLVVERAAT